MSRLIDHPNWGYLLQEFYNVYRFSSAGGSARIRTHLRTVREELNRAIRANPTVMPGDGSSLPVCNHLGRAIDNGEEDRMKQLVKATAKISDSLTWRYGYERMPRGLREKYAFCELLGPSGPVVWNTLILGVVLFAPRTVYPQHSHEGITESYVCLSGAVSENDIGVYVPGSLILNLPGQEHVITTPDREPVLLAYAWTGDPARLMDSDMKFSKKFRPLSSAMARERL